MARHYGQLDNRTMRRRRLLSSAKSDRHRSGLAASLAWRRRRLGALVQRVTTMNWKMMNRSAIETLATMTTAMMMVVVMAGE
jgi:hypothetical protein